DLDDPDPARRARSDDRAPAPCRPVVPRMSGVARAGARTTGVARPAARSARARPGEVARWVFLAAVGLFFLLPQLAMARFAFQNVPVVHLDLGTLGTGWSLDRLTQALAEPALWETARTSLGLAVLAVVLNLALLLPLAVLA